MGKVVFFLGVVGTLVLTGLGWSRLSLDTFTGDVDGKAPGHPCPTLLVRFDGDESRIPSEVRACACAEAAPDSATQTAVHPPKELASTAVGGDQIRLSWHEYRPVLGGEKMTASSWELVRDTRRQNYGGAPAGPIYTNLILTGLAPFAIGSVLALVVSLLFRRRGAE